MAENYTKLQSTTYSQRLEAAPEALKELLTKQIRRTADVIRLVAGFVFLYFLLALGMTLFESTQALLALDTWSIVENAVAGVVHLIGLLAGSLGFYSAKALTPPAAKRFANMLFISFTVYFTYLIVWTVMRYERVMEVLKPAFATFSESEVTASYFLVLGFVCCGFLAVYFLSVAYGMADALQDWKTLSPRQDVSLRSMSLALD